MGPCSIVRAQHFEEGGSKHRSSDAPPQNSSHSLLGTTPCGVRVEFRSGAPVASEPASELETRLEVGSIEGDAFWGRMRKFIREPPCDSENFELEGLYLDDRSNVLNELSIGWIRVELRSSLVR
jgi:hypothetical protein